MFLKKLLHSALLITVTIAMVLVSVPHGNAVYVNPVTTMKVGLYYGSSAMISANLENDVGSGYEFGYFDGSRRFVPLAYTDEIGITMVKDKNLFLTGDTYYDSKPSGSYESIGCFHVRLDDVFSSYEEAAEEASYYDDAFPGYYSGEWRICVGNYQTRAEADDAVYDLGLDGESFTGSAYCITVLLQKQSDIIFEFDTDGEYGLGVMPRSVNSEKTETWFRGFTYYGGFQYTRVDGDNLTVVNVVDLEDYVKGVVPQEVSPYWSEEALKVQTLCARSYAATHIDAHPVSGFDVCNTTCCQVYRGRYNATVESDLAVDETAGQYILYDGEPCETVFHSSSGGATENSENIWGSFVPYLRGVSDEQFENTVNTGYNSWSYTYTADQITEILQRKGYNCSDIIGITPTYTEMGNMYSMTFHDSNGVNWTFSRSNASTILDSDTYGKYTHSQRFVITGSDGNGGSEGNSLYINSMSNPVGSLSGMYAIGGDGEISTVTSSRSVYVMTGSGLEQFEVTGSTQMQTGDTYTVTGSGWGHNVGMSQYGSYAMAKLGYTYDEILKFYYTGVTIG